MSDTDQVIELHGPEPLPLPRPWRANLWLGVLLVLYLAASGLVVVAVYGGASGPDLDADGELLSLFAWLYLAQFAILLPVILAISHFARQSWRVTLAVRAVAAKTLVGWLAVWAVYQVLAVALDQVYQPPIDDFLARMNGSRHLGLSLVVVLLAPLLEEALFRGYLFKAWRATRLGATGTVVLTSLLFTVLHAGQYHFSVLLQLWLLALILGWSREQTGSILTPWLLHTVNNLFATVMVTYLGYY